MIMWISFSAVCAGGLLVLIMRRSLIRRRIARLEWPDRFGDWKTLRHYSCVFLKMNGWQYTTRVVRATEGDLNKSGRWAAVQFLIEREHSKNLPYHFLNNLAANVERFNRPVVLITDFRLPDEVVVRSKIRHVYPVHWKDLERLDDLVPTLKEFRKLHRKERRPKPTRPQISA